ncbi:MAG: hypothetical protein JSV44_04630 [Candidatus Zixiibacteriota bacterium]|nr:MAG: hypothetical protein JSV44_04630 [candidate division Zixibacteria bacterium]
MVSIRDRSISDEKTKTFRWFFYIALTQFLMYFIVPVFIFPGKVIKDIEIISALTFGILVGLFFGLVNILGLFFDKSRRVLYKTMLLFIILYFIWAIVSWSFIEKMNYLLR